MEEQFYVDVPPQQISEDDEMSWKNVTQFDSLEEAVNFTKKHYLSDSLGRVNLITPAPEDPLFHKTDWELLRKQKEQVFKLMRHLDMNATDEYNEDVEALDGIINFLDTFQDYAVDVMGIDENKVFNFNGK